MGGLVRRSARNLSGWQVDKEGSNRFPVTHLVVGVRASSLGDGGALLRATGPEGGRGGDGNRGSDGGRHLGFGGSGRARSSWRETPTGEKRSRMSAVRFARVTGFESFLGDGTPTLRPARKGTRSSRSATETRRCEDDQAILRQGACTVEPRPLSPQPHRTRGRSFLV